MYNINLIISISVPIIGDESISLIDPPAEFSYNKVGFDDYKYKDKLSDNNGEISLDYRYALHGNDEKYVLCLELEKEVVVQHDSPANSFAFMQGDDLKRISEFIQAQYEEILHQYFSMLHLFKEGEIARKHTFYQFKTEEGICKSTQNSDSICADIITLIRYPMILEEREVLAINEFTKSHSEAYRMLKLLTIDELEYSYHILDDATNYKNLITPLEVMFLNNDHGTKKEMLAKRIAVFLGKNNTEIINLYNAVRKHYTDRSEAVHEGTVTQISRTTLNELRDLVRMSIKGYINLVETELSTNPAASFEDIKRNLIPDLMTKVELKKTASILPQ